MDPIVSGLRDSRAIDVPADDEAPLVQHWTRMRRLRSEVDESRLADAEIAVTWSATGSAAGSAAGGLDD